MKYFIQNTKGLEIATQFELNGFGIESNLDLNFPKIIHFESISENLFHKVFAYESIYKFISSGSFNTLDELKNTLIQFSDKYHFYQVIYSIVIPNLDKELIKNHLEKLNDNNSNIKVKIWIFRNNILIGEQIRKFE